MGITYVQCVFTQQRSSHTSHEVVYGSSGAAPADTTVGIETVGALLLTRNGGFSNMLIIQTYYEAPNHSWIACPASDPWANKLR